MHIMWRICQYAPQKSNFPWRILTYVPQKYGLVLSGVGPHKDLCGTYTNMRHRTVTFCGACRPMRHKISFDNVQFWTRVGPREFLWRILHMRHRKPQFYGALVFHAPDKFKNTVEHMYLCPTEIFLWSTHF
jgi:hypothetical protein